MIFFDSAHAATTNIKLPQDMGMWDRIQAPVDISANGHEIMGLFNYTTGMVIFFFTLVCIGLFGFSYFYSEKRNKKPYYTYGNKKNHKYVGLFFGLAVFVLIDMAITVQSNNDLVKIFFNFPKGKDVVRVQIMAQQWLWKFRYPGADNVFNTDDDIVTINDLRLPIDKKVVVQMTSKDVIHSFYLPNVHQKRDAMPGRLSRMWFELKKTGEYDIACAEMCGTHHYIMKAKLTVYTQDEYSKWLNRANNIALAENDPEDLDRYWGWKWEE